jgi:hypothetical protein
MPAHHGYDERMAEHRRRALRRLAATRRVTATQEGRRRLSALRRVTTQAHPPRQAQSRRHPSIVLGCVFVAELLLFLAIAERAG